MIHKRISELPAAGTLNGFEWVETLQGGINKRVRSLDVGGGAGDELRYIGNWNGTTAFPTTGGNGPAGAPSIGDIWRVTHSDGLTVGGDTWPQGTLIMPIVDTPGQTVSSWLKFSMMADETGVEDDGIFDETFDDTFE